MDVLADDSAGLDLPVMSLTEYSRTPGSSRCLVGGGGGCTTPFMVLRTLALSPIEDSSGLCCFLGGAACFLTSSGYYSCFDGTTWIESDGEGSGLRCLRLEEVCWQDELAMEDSIQVKNALRVPWSFLFFALLEVEVFKTCLGDLF